MRILRNNGLSLAMFALFAAMLAGHSCAGHAQHNIELGEDGRPPIAFVDYLSKGAFIESVFENWESEFLQMAAYVLFTIWLYQKGSPESKKLDGPDSEDEDPRIHTNNPNAPWPVRKGGFVLVLYENSLSIALLALFFVSLVFHAVGGTMDQNGQLLSQGKPTITVTDYLISAKFWFESFQNWQSEFLSVGVLVVLQIYLRQRGSAESKPVAASNDFTGH